MGIPYEGARRILATVRRLGLTGSVLTLGRQMIYITLDDLFGLFSERTLNGDMLYSCYTADRLRPILDELMEKDELLCRNPDHRRAKFITDQAFFRLIGFDSLLALDKSSYENADVLYDLNRAEPPVELTGRFALVFDGGTIEHVFHLPNVFKNIYDFLKIDGVVIHQAPTNNYIDHGFYQISPTLLVDYYCANDYFIEECYLYYKVSPGQRAPWFMLEYRPGCLDESWQNGGGNRNDSGLAACNYGTSFVARKTQVARCDQVPDQGAFVHAWKKAHSATAM
jgi:hypothetical protein